MSTSNSREKLTHVFLALMLAVGAGILIGYALFGMDDPVTIAESPNTVPLLQAIATSVAPPEPTPDLMATVRADIPLCADSMTMAGDVCLPVYVGTPPCHDEEVFYNRADAIPCIKQKP